MTNATCHDNRGTHYDITSRTVYLYPPGPFEDMPSFSVQEALLLAQGDSPLIISCRLTTEIVSMDDVITDPDLSNNNVDASDFKIRVKKKNV